MNGLAAVSVSVTVSLSILATGGYHWVQTGSAVAATSRRIRAEAAPQLDFVLGLLPAACVAEDFLASPELRSDAEARTMLRARGRELARVVSFLRPYNRPSSDLHDRLADLARYLSHVTLVDDDTEIDRLFAALDTASDVWGASLEETMTSTIDPLLQIAVGLEILEPFSIADELLSDPDIERRVALNPVLSSARKVGCLRNGFAAFANRMDELTSEDHDVD